MKKVDNAEALSAPIIRARRTDADGAWSLKENAPNQFYPLEFSVAADVVCVFHAVTGRGIGTISLADGVISPMSEKFRAGLMAVYAGIRKETALMYVQSLLDKARDYPGRFEEIQRIQNLLAAVSEIPDIEFLTKPDPFRHVMLPFEGRGEEGRIKDNDKDDRIKDDRIIAVADAPQ